MTSDFEGFSIPDFMHYIYFPILILEKEPVRLMYLKICYRHDCVHKTKLCQRLCNCLTPFKQSFLAGYLGITISVYLSKWLERTTLPKQMNPH